MNILTQLDTQKKNNMTSSPPALLWKNTNIWTCECGVMYQTPHSGSLRHLCKKCGEDVSRRLLLSKSMKLVDDKTSFYSHNHTEYIESTDVLSWSALNLMIISGGLSAVYLNNV
jgi:hypothetical protein